MVKVRKSNILAVERKNHDLKYEYLKQHNDNSISGMVTVLVEQFLPENMISNYLSVWIFSPLLL